MIDCKENHEVGNPYRKEYLEGINKLIVKKQQEKNEERAEFSKNIFIQPEEYRQQFKDMLGWPLNEKDDKIPNVKKVAVKNEKVIIYRLQIEVLKDLWFYGILFLKDETRKRPLIISQHGGQGTPELCSSMLESGSSNYNDMTERIFAHDVNVFAPQMLLWNKECYKIDFERDQIDAKLKQVGSSITAIEVYALMKSIDYLEKQPFVDENRIGMIGLSYGGFYTLFAAACDTRIKSAFSSCQFGDRYEYPNFIDWNWFDAAGKFLDAEIACLIYPRKLRIECGISDELFDVKKQTKEFERLKKMCEKVGTEWVEYRTFEGTHEFCRDNTFIDGVIKDLEEYR